MVLIISPFFICNRINQSMQAPTKGPEMKKISLALACALIAISGCKNDSGSGVSSETEAVKGPDKEVLLNVDLLPNGRWFYNPLYCSNELPVVGPYDFTVSGNDLTYIGITDHGQWQRDDSNSAAKNSFKEFLVSKNDCLKADIGEFVLMKYVGQTTSYTFGYSDSNKIMLRFVDGNTELIVPFDVEAIKKLTIVDNTERSMPDDVAPEGSAPEDSGV